MTQNFKSLVHCAELVLCQNDLNIMEPFGNELERRVKEMQPTRAKHL